MKVISEVNNCEMRVICEGIMRADSEAYFAYLVKRGIETVCILCFEENESAGILLDDIMNGEMKLGGSCLSRMFGKNEADKPEERI